VCCGGVGPFPEKKLFFVVKKISFGALHFNAVLTGRKHVLSLELSLGDVYFTVQSRNEAYKNSAKTIQKFTVRPKRGGGGCTPPPEYATH